jgi:hypothetical protein
MPFPPLFTPTSVSFILSQLVEARMLSFELDTAARFGRNAKARRAVWI